MPVVLLVDDDNLVRSTVARSLGQLGCCVREANDGAAALDVLAREPIDLIVTDLEMPRMDGEALVAAVRARQTALPIVVVSGNGHSAEGPSFAGAMRAGASLCLKKPFSMAALEAALRPYLGPQDLLLSAAG